jgi:hypothetical protein
MLKIHQRRTFQLGMALLVLFASMQTFAANYPLELVSPRAAGTSPASGNAAITAENRIFKAYPGIEYNIRAVIVGGAYPFTFSLSNAPSGMTINPRTGEIRWPSPPAGTVTPTITVRDAEGTERSSPWTITVSTAGFKFIDSVNGRAYPTGTGTIDNPWRNISDIVSARTADIVYFRTGEYNTTGIQRSSVGSPWERVELGAEYSNKWIAFPGDSPIIDFGYRQGGDPGALIRLNSNNLYIDGFEARNLRIIGFQVHSGRYGVFRRLRMHDLNMAGVSNDGSNSAFIMTMSSYSDSGAGGNASSWGQYLAIQDSEFYNAPADCTLKMYSQWKLVIEDNLFRDTAAGPELKADLPQVSYRHNTHRNIPRIVIGGNMHSYTFHGEILFNLVLAPNSTAAIDVNQDGFAKRVDVYRNTVVGVLRVRNVDSSDGPFRVYDNVIINNDSGTRVRTESVSDTSRIQITNNLTGSPSSGIVDSSGLLTSANVQYLGTRGYQIGNEVRPRPPTGVVAN